MDKIRYLDVQFVLDALVGHVTYRAGTRITLPEHYARSLGEAVRIVGDGTPSRIVFADEQDLFVPAKASKDDAAAIVATTGPQETTGAPWGVGRRILLEPGQHLVKTWSLPSSSSLVAPAIANAVLKYAAHATVTADTGVIAVADDRLSNGGFVGRGTIENVEIDGASGDAAHAFLVHGFYGSPVSDGIFHTVYDSRAKGCKGDGWHIETRDQLITHRAKGGDNTRYGMYLRNVSDSKHYSPGFQGNLYGALYLEHCATPKFYGGDMGGPNSGFLGYFTVTLVDQAHAMFDGTEISGRVGILGRNDQGGSVRYDMANNLFRAVNFKIDESLPPSFVYTRPDLSTITISATMYVEDADGTDLDLCSLYYGEVTPTQAMLDATPDYFLQIESNTSVGNQPMRRGSVRISNAHGLVHRRGRAGDTPATVCWKKRLCAQNHLVEWDRPPGELVFRPYDGVNVERDLVLAGAYGGSAATYNKADYPLGYEAVNPTGTQDDGVPTFSVMPTPFWLPVGMGCFMRTY